MPHGHFSIEKKQSKLYDRANIQIRGIINLLYHRPLRLLTKRMCISSSSRITSLGKITLHIFDYFFVDVNKRTFHILIHYIFLFIFLSQSNFPSVFIKFPWKHLYSSWIFFVPCKPNNIYAQSFIKNSGSFMSILYM